MNRSAFTSCFLASLLFLAGSAENAFAHGEGVLIQNLGTRLVTGAGDDAPGNQQIGNRVFSSRLGSDGLSQSPSFFSLIPAPVGTESLPGGVDIYWDFLPMTIDGSVSNLFYWDALGQVDFTPAVSETFTLHDPNFNQATVDGLAEPVPGLRIGTTTGSALNLHAHRWWWLQGTSETPAEGVYLATMRLWADGYVPTEPIFFAFSTYATPLAALDSVLPWLEGNVDLLVPRGDYNFDGYVDALDYNLWKLQFASTELPPVSEGYADGNRDGVVDLADYTVWRNNLGASGAVNAASIGSAQAVAAVPEPSALVICVVGLLIGLVRSRPNFAWQGRGK